MCVYLRQTDGDWPAVCETRGCLRRDRPAGAAPPGAGAAEFVPVEWDDGNGMYYRAGVS